MSSSFIFDKNLEGFLLKPAAVDRDQSFKLLRTINLGNDYVNPVKLETFSKQQRPNYDDQRLLLDSSDSDSQDSGQSTEIIKKKNKLFGFEVKKPMDFKEREYKKKEIQKLIKQLIYDRKILEEYLERGVKIPTYVEEINHNPQVFISEKIGDEIDGLSDNSSNQSNIDSENLVSNITKPINSDVSAQISLKEEKIQQFIPIVKNEKVEKVRKLLEDEKEASEDPKKIKRSVKRLERLKQMIQNKKRQIENHLDNKNESNLKKDSPHNKQVIYEDEGHQIQGLTLKQQKLLIKTHEIDNSNMVSPQLSYTANIEKNK